MAEKQPYFRLGLFVLITLILLFCFLFFLGGRALFKPTLTFETYFDQSVSGLEVGAQVEFRGVPIGHVTEILMSSPLYEIDVPLGKRRDYVVVRAQVSGNAAQVKQWQHDWPEFVKLGLRAQTQLAGITGQQFLALNHENPTQYTPLPFDWEPEYPYIPSVPSLAGQIVTKFQEFLASFNSSDLEGLGKNLNQLIVSLNQKINQIPVGELSIEARGVLEETRSFMQQAKQIIAAMPINQAVANFSKTSGHLDKLLSDPAIPQTLRNVASASARIDELLARPVRQTMDNAAVFTAHLSKIAETGKIDRLVSQLDQTIQRIDTLVGNNQYDVRVIVQDLRVTASNLRSLSETAKRYPAGILFGEPPAKSDMPWKETK